MDWLTSLKKAIDYMEEHMLDNISAADVADAVYISPFYFQKGFKIVTGYSSGNICVTAGFTLPGWMS